MDENTKVKIESWRTGLIETTLGAAAKYASLDWLIVAANIEEHGRCDALDDQNRDIAILPIEGDDASEEDHWIAIAQEIRAMFARGRTPREVATYIEEIAAGRHNPGNGL
jgi:hypothetical protein